VSNELSRRQLLRRSVGAGAVVIGFGAALPLCLSAGPALAARAVPSYTAVALESPAAGDYAFLGHELAAVGDLDSDGVTDIAVSSATQPSPSTQPIGRVWLFSGRTREPIGAIQSPDPQPGDGFGHSIASVGDVSGDGVADLVIAATGVDVDVGGARNEDQGRAYLFSGKTGSLIRPIESPAQEGYAYFGSSALAMGDLDGDGFGDVVAVTWEKELCDADADPATPARPCSFVGAAYTISGKDGSVLHRFASPDPPAEYAFFGNGISNPGDVTGDGADDLVFGAPRTSPMGAYLFNGKTGQLVRRIAPPAGVDPNAQFGFGKGSGVEPGDVNGDGIRDLIVADPGQSGGRMYLLSGADSALIRTLADPDPHVVGSLGSFHASAGDVNADGTPDVIGMRGFGGPGASPLSRPPQRTCSMAQPAPSWSRCRG
jgi:hypothetical protein